MAEIGRGPEHQILVQRCPRTSAVPGPQDPALCCLREGGTHPGVCGAAEVLFSQEVQASRCPFLRLSETKEQSSKQEIQFACSNPRSDLQKSWWKILVLST